MNKNRYCIYILQMHSNSKVSNFIKLFTRYKYSHVSLSLDINCDTIYSFGRKVLDNPFDGGFIVQNKNGKFYKKFNKTKCRIYELEITKEQFESLQVYINKMKENKDKYKYDFLGIGLRFFRIPVCFKDKYVCSYFVADVLEKNKIYKFNKDAAFVEPKDFEKLRNSKVIYEGKYLNYCNNSI